MKAGVTVGEGVVVEVEVGDVVDVVVVGGMSSRARLMVLSPAIHKVFDPAGPLVMAAGWDWPGNPGTMVTAPAVVI